MTSPRFLRSPRIWFSRSRLILTSRARLTRRALIAWLSRSLTRTSLYHPHCMMRAMPTASLRSLLLICNFRAAFACLASMQMTGSPTLFNSVHSHVDVAPVSSPTRATCGALRLDECRDGLRVGCNHPFALDLSRPIDDTDRCQLQRYVQSDIVLHCSPASLQGPWVRLVDSWELIARGGVWLDPGITPCVKTP